MYLYVCVLRLPSGKLIYVIIKQELYNALNKYYVGTEKIHNIKTTNKYMYSIKISCILTIYRYPRLTFWGHDFLIFVHV